MSARCRKSPSCSVQMINISAEEQQKLLLLRLLSLSSLSSQGMQTPWGRRKAAGGGIHHGPTSDTFVLTWYLRDMIVLLFPKVLNMAELIVNQRQEAIQSTTSLKPTHVSYSIYDHLQCLATFLFTVVWLHTLFILQVYVVDAVIFICSLFGKWSKLGRK